MHQTTQDHPASWLAPRPPLPGSCSHLIHLGSARDLDQLDLAHQTISKIRRYESTATLLVADDETGSAPPFMPPSCCLASTGELLNAIRGGARLLVPAFNDTSGALTLHALATGIPLGALNMVAPSLHAPGELVRAGSVWLAISAS